MMPELDGVHMEVVRWLTGMSPRKVKGKWVYQHSADVLAEAYLLTTHRVLHPETSPHRPQHNPGPRRSEGVQGRGEAPRHPTPLVLGGAGHEGAGTVGVRRGRGGGRTLCTLPGGVPRACGPAGAAHYCSGGAAVWGHAADGRGGGSALDPGSIND